MNARQSKRVTLNDIALAVGMDNSTVSLALRNDTRIKEVTRNKIQQMAMDMNYVPNRLARSLSSKGTQSIGILFESLASQFHVPCVESFYEVLEGQGYTLSIQVSLFELERQDRILQQFAESRVDGVIWAAVTGDEDEIDNSLKILQNSHIPSVMLSGDLSSSLSCMSVGINTWDAVRVGARYLSHLGHHRIGILSGADIKGMRGAQHKTRANLAITALAENGIEIRPEDIFSVSDNEYGAIPIGRILAERLPADRPTAIFAMDDMLGRSLVHGLSIMDLPPPSPISVLGYDNAPGSEIGPHPLTTVSLNTREMGRHAMERLLTQIQASTGLQTMTHERIPPRIVERSTCISVSP